MRNRSLLVVQTILGLALVCATPAGAKVTTDSPYTRAQTLNCALRYIHVDEGFDVVEKDLENGYFLFNYKADAGAASGSIQVLEANGRVRFVVQIPKYPEYHEQVLTKGIRDKLVEEYGVPPAREQPKPKDPPPEPPPEDAPKKPAPKPAEGPTDGQNGQNGQSSPD
jgi:hypothetical protein